MSGQVWDWRFCPDCDEYTRWRKNRFVDCCERDMPGHITFVLCGYYNFRPLSDCGCRAAFVKEDGIACECGIYCYMELYNRLIWAMTQEISRGGLVKPELWTPSLSSQIAKLT